jgi:large subunit ribosomal protein L28
VFHSENLYFDACSTNNYNFNTKQLATDIDMVYNTNIMQICDLTGKTKMSGNNVSFSQRKTKRKWMPNLHKKTIIVNGVKIRLNLSAKAIKTLKKQPKTA